jgi:hypothetical protein
MKESYIQDTT